MIWTVLCGCSETMDNAQFVLTITYWHPFLDKFWITVELISRIWRILSGRYCFLPCCNIHHVILLHWHHRERGRYPKLQTGFVSSNMLWGIPNHLGWCWCHVAMRANILNIQFSSENSTPKTLPPAQTTFFQFNPSNNPSENASNRLLNSEDDDTTGTPLGM